MKSSFFPLVRVDSELQHVAEKTPRCGETLLGFVEQPIRPQVERINLQQEFIKRGLASAESARSSGEYYPAGQVLAELEEVLTTVRKKRGK